MLVEHYICFAVHLFKLKYSNSKSLPTVLFSLEFNWKKLFLHWGHLNTFPIQRQHIVWPQWFKAIGLLASRLYISKQIIHSSAFTNSASFLASITVIIWKLSNVSLHTVLPQLSCWHILFLLLTKHFLQTVCPQFISKIGLCSV